MFLIANIFSFFKMLHLKLLQIHTNRFFPSTIWTKDICFKCKKVFKVQEVSDVVLEVLVSRELYDTYQCIVRNYI